ncbi:phosphorylase [Paracoccus suum]|uniref:Phosphorylase n=1 Tax=Paracoccus suum TaxID=2259340 RepID=A0A344PPF4_9RHOB|nr:phosphorylase [Paracoccus suum]
MAPAGSQQPVAPEAGAPAPTAAEPTSAGAPAQVPARPAPDPTPRIAIVSAFAPEWPLLKSAITDPAEVRINGTTFVTGTLGGKPVVLFLSGVSMVNAAMTMQLALDQFAIRAIAFSGIAGGVDPALHIGDVVVADRWGQYLEAVFARETEGKFAIPGWMPPAEFGNYGMIFPNAVEVASNRTAEPQRQFWFAADPALLEVARKVSDKGLLAACDAEKQCLSHPPQVVVGGSGVSGAAFVDNKAFREWVFATFTARVLDMESAAVAHVAYANEVPFIAFRSLSDLAGGGEGENEMKTFMALAAANSAAVVEAFVAELPALTP